VDCPLNLYTLLKFGASDVNVLEFKNYKRMMDTLPADTHQYFARILGIEENNGRSVSICELVENADGGISKTLKDTGRIADNDFWEHLEFVRQRLLEYGVPYFGTGKGNVLVKNDGISLLPVFVDVKCVGANMYLFQPWLHFKSMRERKINHAFDKLRREFQAVEEGVTIPT